MAIINERIMKRIQDLGLSYDDVSKMTGISKSAIHRYATGQRENIPISKIKDLASALQTSTEYLTGWDDDQKVTFLSKDYIRQIPVYESASAGFGVVANPTVLEYIPIYIKCQDEADNTLCITVSGDSMYPKIEDGDIIQVRKQTSVDSGSIAVVLLNGEEALVKRVVYDDEHIELQSINPEYAPKIFKGAEVQRVQVVGLVRKIIKNV